MKFVGLIVGALLTMPLDGQPAFVNLVANADGSAIGFSLARDITSKDGSLSRMSSNTRLRWVDSPKQITQISSDGSRIQTRHSTTVLGRRPGCSGGSSCIVAITTTSFAIDDVADPTSAKTLWAPGDNAASQAWMNSNGRDVVWQADSRTMLTDLTVTPSVTRLLSEQRGAIQDRLADGRLLIASETGLQLRSITDGSVEALTFRPIGPYVFWRKISADGSRIIYASGNPGFPGYSLRAQNTRTGEDVEIHKGRSVQFFGTNTDGTVTLFGETQEEKHQLLLATPHGVQRLLDGEPVYSAALSADGRYAFCVTTRGRILRIDLEAVSVQILFGEVGITELVPRTPRISHFYNWPTPGSQVLVYGSGLADRKTLAPPGEAWPQGLDGIRLGTPEAALPLGMVSPTLIRTQIPFDAPAILEKISVTSESPFQQLYSMALSGFSPSLIRASFLSESGVDNLYQPAVYRDTNPRELIEGQFGSVGPVSRGERIHLYATGMGPVSPAVATGAPAPEQPPARITESFACWMENSKSDVAVEFAGLETGMVGIYRITVRLPQQIAAFQDVALRCGNDPARVGGLYLGLLIAPQTP